MMEFVNTSVRPGAALRGLPRVPFLLERRERDIKNMDTFIQQIINGLVLGSMYALIALGYTMVYGVLNLINFAHGDVLMIGAMVGLT
ncbi:MAG TPA: branched-chain amino acid ABC transporter permease, partial [Telluria sp.]|nr:branched-chain amino acid ABC transporter permease [Telluria sp.]